MHGLFLIDLVVSLFFLPPFSLASPELNPEAEVSVPHRAVQHPLYLEEEEEEIYISEQMQDITDGIHACISLD